jgi:hypothetical protein
MYQNTTSLRFHSYLTTGSSTPIVVQDDAGSRFFVKLRGGQSGRYSYLCEWICGHLGYEIGLPINKPGLITIDETLEIGKIHEEVKDLIHKSFGLNLAFPFYENIRPCAPDRAHAVHTHATAALFAFDIFLLNTDRTIRNPNLMEAEGLLRSFDYETSFLLMGIMQDKDFSTSDFVLQALRENPICQAELDEKLVSNMFERLRGVDLTALVDSLPEAWISGWEISPEAVKDKLKKGLTEAIVQPEKFEETLKLVRTVTPENEAVKRKRRADNLAKFEAGKIPMEIFGEDGKPLP